jgi:hypothetical protein
MLLALALAPATHAQSAERTSQAPSKTSAVTNQSSPNQNSGAQSAGANSETRLLERRAERIKQLPPAPEPPQVAGPTANPIDQFIVAGWAELETSARPSTLCDDATFARRAYLDLIGVIPSVIELNRFLVDAAPDKRAKLVDRLLARRSDYAHHWLPFWEDALASQTVLDQGGVPTHGNYRPWILASFAANKPYDVMVAELLDPSMPGRQPARNEEIFGVPYRIEYVRNEDLTVTLQTAANVGQVFLSTAMKCASCHDHFENPEWTQQRFLGFAGLFAPRDLERVRCDVHTGQIVPARFPWEVPSATTATPTKMTERLNLAAQLITDPANERFSKSIVNRLWKRYLGLGLFEPADDYRPGRGVSHPELLDWLARDFMTHGYNLQHTIRLILTSRTYQSPYSPEWADRFDPSAPATPRYFRSPALRRLTAEQLLDSMRMATAGELQDGDRACIDSRITELARVLGRPASRNEISTARSGDAAVVQSLELLNGAEMQALIDSSELFAKPLRKQDLKRLTDRLYHMVLSRPATSDERRLGQLFLASEQELDEAVRDMYWVLFASPEFQFIK